MKFRQGFVSNSSSTSFVIVGIKLSEKEFKKRTKDEFAKFKKDWLKSFAGSESDAAEEAQSKGESYKVDNDEIWEEFLYEYDGFKGLETHVGEGDDNDVYIGVIDSVEYFEEYNVGYFATAAKKVSKVLGVPISKIKVFVEYSGQM